MTARNPEALKVYRVGQVAVQTVITAHLYQSEGWQGAVAFNLIWWTWTCDYAYYGWAVTLNPSAPWENRSYNGLQNKITWAYWTPIGLAHRKGEPLSRDVLTMQALMGLACAAVMVGSVKSQEVLPFTQEGK